MSLFLDSTKCEFPGRSAVNFTCDGDIIKPTGDRSDSANQRREHPSGWRSAGTAGAPNEHLRTEYSHSSACAPNEHLRTEYSHSSADL